MWGSGLGHGFLMMVGWLLGLLALGGAVYIAVLLATRRRAEQVARAFERLVGISDEDRSE